ncbi:MAG: NAD-dependent epimerase/dehydratase family protein [Chloroflexia bacterium]
MRVLIIGGTGNISTATTRALIARGDRVAIFNRGRSRSTAAIPDGVERLIGDRADRAAFERAMRDAGPFDCVIDMIAYLPEDAESAIRAFQGRVGQYIFCSTIDVYTKPASRYPYTEAEPYGGIGDYARNKVRCERILLDAHARGDLPLTIIRPAATYGEGRGMVHSFGGSTTYHDRLRKGKSIVVHGDGTSLWVSCHRDDVGRAFANAAGNARTIGRSYHVTGEEWLTWNRYHALVAEAMGAPPPALVHIPTELLAAVAPRARICAENFQYNNIFDNSAARADLDFRYTIPFVEGVRRAVAWLDANGRIANSDDDPYDDRVIAAWQQLGADMGRALAGLGT